MKYGCLLFLLILFGCSPVTVEEDFTNYVASIGKNQQVFADKMNALQLEPSQKTDFAEFSQQKLLPIMKEYLDSITALQPRTEEVATLNRKYVEGIGLLYESFSSTLLSSKQEHDPAKTAESVKKLERARALALEWSTAMNDLAQTYKVELPNIDFYRGTGLIRMPADAH